MAGWSPQEVRVRFGDPDEFEVLVAIHLDAV
jgi:hypothetical protein